MLNALKALVQQDKDYPERAHTINTLELFRTSKIYDKLKNEFFVEKDANDEYVPLKDRAPSVRYGLPMIVVNDSTSLLFSEGHFPAVELKTKGDGKSKGKDALHESTSRLADLLKAANLRETMLEAAVKGSVGSVAIIMRILEGRIFFETKTTTFLTPKFKKQAPDTLEMLTEKYKVKGRDLEERGYAIPSKDLDRDFWFEVRWTEQAEEWMKPVPVVPEKDETAYPAGVDAEKSADHNLGFCPAEWIKNLPGGVGVDGACTFEAALPQSIEIDYLLSQGGRGLKYASDPTLHIREPAFQEGGPITKGAGNAIVTSSEGEVRVLEISGTANAAVLEHVRALREFGIELCGGNRASPERLSGAQSGRAMELMNQSLIWLADKLRTSYGEKALVSIVRKIIKANAKMMLRIDDEDVLKLGELKGKPSLKWPPWYQPTAGDHQQMATALGAYRQAGLISRRTGIAQIAHDFDIEDADAEAAEIEKEEDELRAADAAGATPKGQKQPGAANGAVAA